jgi:hypothetical protein
MQNHRKSFRLLPNVVRTITSYLTNDSINALNSITSKKFTKAPKKSLIKSPKKSPIESSKGDSIESSEEDSIESSKGDFIESSKGDSIESSKGDSIEPLEELLIWKKRTEKLVGKKLIGRNINWKEIYDYIRFDPEPLLRASKDSNINVVSILIESDYYLFHPDEYNDAMAEASSKGHYDVYGLLLNNPIYWFGKPKNKSENDMWKKRVEDYLGKHLMERNVIWEKIFKYIQVLSRPLVNAARDGNIDVVSILLEANYKSSDYKMYDIAREEAINNGHFNIVNLFDLKSSNIVPNIASNFSAPTLYNSNEFYNAIVNAFDFGRYDIFESLLNDRKVHKYNRNTAFIKISENNRYDIIPLLLKNKLIDPAYDKNEAFITASAKGNIKVVELLLNDSRVDPSDQHNQAIIDASQNGRYNIVELLLNDSRVDPSDQYNDAIIQASDFGHYDIVELLLDDPRVDPSDQENEAIIRASKYGYYDIVQLLINDPRVDPSDHNNKALKLASKNRHRDVVELLSEYMD